MRWVTYFPIIHNIHLTKDLGMLPKFMGQISGNEAALVGHFPDKDYPALNGEMGNLKTVHLPTHGHFLFLDKAALRYLRKSAKDIDVLNLYHLSRHTLIYGLLYKMANPKGLLYLKMDAYNAHLQAPKRYAKGGLKNFIFRKLEKRFLMKLDLASVENKEGLALAKKAYPQIADRLVYLPNGCNDDYLGQLNRPDQKEKIILSVGRIGGEDKNYDLLLDAIPNLNMGEWRMEIIGPMTEAFAAKWSEVQVRYPAKTKNIKFLGAIYNREILYQHYAKARVFFLTSRFESFGIAYVEALYFGAILVGHKGMSAYDDISNKGAFGTYYSDNNPDSFATALLDAKIKSEDIQVVEAARKHTANNFYWSEIAKKLNEQLHNASS